LLAHVSTRLISTSSLSDASKRTRPSKAASPPPVEHCRRCHAAGSGEARNHLVDRIERDRNPISTIWHGAATLESGQAGGCARIDLAVDEGGDTIEGRGRSTAALRNQQLTRSPRG